MSYGCCSSLGKMKSFGNFDSHVYTSSNMRWKSCCHCGDVLVLHRATTLGNHGEQFWSCPYFKVNGKSSSWEK